eukprot:TRINITY_DN3985_c0_g1_i1.p1 TRINITY_DN3985_c0_g1~~TRINITY_DN3985_c0_g1_i1.p1  ORF type:complete len:401 (-),score=67.19 TRINITY_DN3985_c0_g1_i1:12-1214(-)
MWGRWQWRRAQHTQSSHTTHARKWKSRILKGVLLTAGAVDLFYLMQVVSPPDPKAVYYHLDSFYYRPYEKINNFYNSPLFSVFNNYIPNGIKEAHIRAISQNPVDYAFNLLKEDGETKQGVIKFIDMMNRLSYSDSLLDDAVSRGFFGVLLRNANKVDFQFDREMYKMSQVAYDPLSTLLKPMLNKKRTRELCKIEDLHVVLQDLYSVHPAATVLILQRMTEDPFLNELFSKNGNFEPLLERINSEEIFYVNTDEVVLPTLKMIPYMKPYAACTSLLWGLFLVNQLKNPLTFLKLFSTSLSKSVFAFGTLQFLTYASDNILSSYVARSEKWQLTREVTVFLHLMLLVGCGMLSHIRFVVGPYLFVKWIMPCVEQGYYQFHFTTNKAFFTQPMDEPATPPK